jgi:DNA-binding MarR family transcriptional regulator
MPDNTEQLTKIYELMTEVRKFTRSTLLHQHVIAQAIGLNVTDAECIDFLQEAGGSCTAGELAKATRLTTGAITNVIDRLEKAGFVKRSPNPNDRRKVMVNFVPQKHTPAKIHYVALAQQVQALLTNYNVAQLELLAGYTQAMAGIYQNEVAKINAVPVNGK